MAGNQETLKQLLGKTIKGVIVKRDKSGSRPGGQVFLVFSDDTAFEFYSDNIILIASGLDTGGMKKARAYLTAPDKKDGEVHYIEASLDEE